MSDVSIVVGIPNIQTNVTVGAPNKVVSVDTGVPGASNILNIGTVDKGDVASATITGTSPAQTLNLVLPKGDKGDNGAGLPYGGLTNQVLTKIDNVNGNTYWATVDKTFVGLANVDNTADINKPVSSATQTALDTKVDKITGKGLSTNDYTTTEQTKLAGIATGANVGVVPNIAIVGATKTKITYDTKGLVTAGADAVLDDLGDVIISSPVIDQVVKYNGTNWVNGSSTAVNGGSGVDFFYVNTASDIATYNVLSKSPDAGVEVDDSVVVNNNRVLISSYASASTGLGGTQIDAGVWNFDIWAYVSMLNLASSIDIDIYKRTSGGTETLLFSVNSGTINTTSLATVEDYVVTSVQQAFSINSTDRLVAKIYGKTSNITNTTVHFLHGGTTHYSHFNTPLVTRHNDLVGLQGGTSSEYYHLTSNEYQGAGAGTGNIARLISPQFTTPNIGVATGSISGNSGSATVLQTARNINGVSFNGSADINIVQAIAHGTASTAQLVNVCYGTGTPPAANTTTEGTLYITYVA